MKKAKSLSDFQVALQQHLRKEADKSGHTMSDLSRSIGKDRSFLSLYLSGRRVIGLSALLDIAAILPVDDWMLDEAEREEEVRIAERDLRFELNRSCGSPSGWSLTDRVRELKANPTWAQVAW